MNVQADQERWDKQAPCPTEQGRGDRLSSAHDTVEKARGEEDAGTNHELSGPGSLS